MGKRGRVKERPRPGSPTEAAVFQPEQVACLAYAIWVQRGRPEGTDQEDWFEAERRLTRGSAQPHAGR
jgi:Protein of unknown function (DUF2934)